MTERRGPSLPASLAVLASIALVGSAWLLLGRSTETTPDNPAKLARSAPDIPRAPISTDHMPPPFGERGIREPDPEAPPIDQTAAFCDEDNWPHLDTVVSKDDAGEFRVDESAWHGTLAGTRANLASWMSLCERNGAPVRIVSADTGDLLATYSPGAGLRSF